MKEKDILKLLTEFTGIKEILNPERKLNEIRESSTYCIKVWKTVRDREMGTPIIIAVFTDLENSIDFAKRKWQKNSITSIEVQEQDNNGEIKTMYFHDKNNEKYYFQNERKSEIHKENDSKIYDLEEEME